MNAGKKLFFPAFNPHFIQQFVAFPPVQNHLFSLRVNVRQFQGVAKLWNCVDHALRVTAKT